MSVHKNLDEPAIIHFAFQFSLIVNKNNNYFVRCEIYIMKTAKISFKDLIKSKTPVLVDFAAEWCQPCKTQKPILQKLASEDGDKIKIITIDVDKNPSISQKYKVMSIPTLAIFQNGEIVYRQTGVHQLSQLKDLVAKYAVKD